MHNIKHVNYNNKLKCEEGGEVKVKSFGILLNLNCYQFKIECYHFKILYLSLITPPHTHIHTQPVEIIQKTRIKNSKCNDTKKYVNKNTAKLETRNNGCTKQPENNNENGSIKSLPTNNCFNHILINFSKQKTWS